jgi:hypothetical protein
VLNGQPVTITGLVTDSINGELSANVQVNGFGTVTTYTLPFTDAGFQTPANTFIIGNLVIHYANDNDLSLTSVSIGSSTSSTTSGSAVVVGGSSTWTFANASASFNGVTEAISGFFDVDPLTNIQWTVDMQLTGPAPYAGACFGSTDLNGPRMVLAHCPMSVVEAFQFANDLVPGVADPLDRVGVTTNYSITNVTGFVITPGSSVPAVSEPGTLGLLVSGLLGIFIMRRRDVRYRWGG